MSDLHFLFLTTKLRYDQVQGNIKEKKRLKILNVYENEVYAWKWSKRYRTTHTEWKFPIAFLEPTRANGLVFQIFLCVCNQICVFMWFSRELMSNSCDTMACSPWGSSAHEISIPGQEYCSGLPSKSGWCIKLLYRLLIPLCCNYAQSHIFFMVYFIFNYASYSLGAMHWTKEIKIHASCNLHSGEEDQ